jgi:hypothetical protein
LFSWYKPVITATIAQLYPTEMNTYRMALPMIPQLGGIDC